MAKITVTIETSDNEDPREALGRFLGITGQPMPPDKASGKGEWTLEDFSSFWSDLSTDARKILVVIAKHPDGCSAQQIEKDLGWSGLQIAGRLSSLGHQLRKRPGLPYPISHDPATGGYK